MDSQILSTLISGTFSLLTGLASIWLNNHMERSTKNEHSLGQPKKHHSISRVFLIITAGLILGASAMISRQYDGTTHYGTLISQFLLIVITLFLAFNHRKSIKGFWPYQLEIISLYFAYGAGFSLFRGAIWSDMVTVVVATWLILAVLGGIIILWKNKVPMEAKESFKHKTFTTTNSKSPDKILGEIKEERQVKNYPESETPLDIVKMRYAKGEITKEEFDQIKEDLA